MALGVAFLSEENVFLRTRTSKSVRLGGKSGQISGSQFNLKSSLEKTDGSSGDKDLDELDSKGNTGRFVLYDNKYLSNSKSFLSKFSYILSDQYLNLPPPV
ncbi:MAG: hypothetical protein O9301_14135 [Leptospira sp.]|nr:hypothetical protein [Leptospira sp.]